MSQPTRGVLLRLTIRRPDEDETVLVAPSGAEALTCSHPNGCQFNCAAAGGGCMYTGKGALEQVA